MKIPQQVTCQCSSENRSAVATNENQFIQVLDLQPIVQRVAKAMRPVKQRQETQCKQINSGERQRDQRMQILVTRSGNPSQGKDRKSTRLNSSHQINSYAVFRLKKKTEKKQDK